MRKNRESRLIARAQQYVAEINETTIRLRIEALPEGRYLATSPDVPGLVAEGRSVTEAVEIAQGLTRKIIESCMEHGAPLPKLLATLELGLMIVLGANKI